MSKLDTTKPATNSAQILRLIGCDKLALYRGNGYWYFVYDDPARNIWHDENIPVCYLGQSSIGFWVNEGKRVVAEVEAKAAQEEAIEADQFVKGYIDAAVWSSSDDNGDSLLDGNFDASDLTTESLQAVREVCADFMSSNRALLAEYYKRYSPAHGYTVQSCAGHDFWLTRNRHGAGFWDRGLGELGDKLSEAAKVYGEQYVTVQDGKLIFS